jgi:hypothetical protein
MRKTEFAHVDFIAYICTIKKFNNINHKKCDAEQDRYTKTWKSPT